MSVPTPVWVLAAAALGGAFLKIAFEFVAKVMAIRRGETTPTAAPDAFAELNKGVKEIAAKLDRLHTDLQVLATQGSNRDGKIAGLEREVDELEGRVRELERRVAVLEAEGRRQ